MAKIINSYKIFGLALIAIVLSGADCTCGMRAQNTLNPNKANEDLLALTNVDRVFNEAKIFARGAKTVSEVKKGFDELTSDEQRDLCKKYEGSSEFVLFMVAGKASTKSIEMLEACLSYPVSKAKELVRGQTLFKEAQSVKRPKSEKLNQLRKLKVSLLIRFPDQINEVKTIDGSFDAPAFNELTANIDAAKTVILIDRLSKSHFDEWLAWALDPANVAAAKPAFKNLRTKLPIDQQQVLNSRLLESKYRSVNRRLEVAALISGASDWGIDLENDIFNLESHRPGTKISGTLGLVLAKRALGEGGAPTIPMPAVYVDLADYMTKLELAMTASIFAVHIIKVVNGESILGAITKELGSHAHFANFLLGKPTVKDVFDAAMKPEAVVSNAMLKDIHSAIILTQPDAQKLALEHDVTTGKRYIHAVVSRSIDSKGNTNWVLDKFLTDSSGGIVANEIAEIISKVSVGPAENAIKIVFGFGAGKLFNKRPAGDDPFERQKMIDRLVENDGGAAPAVDELSADELGAYAVRAYDEMAPSGIKKIYNIISKAPLKKEFAIKLLQRPA